MATTTRTAVRAATPDDARIICDLINEVERAETGTAEMEADEVLHDLTRPGTDPATDSWLAFEGEGEGEGDGRLVAYAVVCDEFGTGRIDVDHYVLPGHQAAGERLLDLMTGRARAAAAGNGAAEAAVHLNLTTDPTLDTSLLRARGWRTIRRYNVLTRPVSAEADADQQPPPPPGVTLRTCATEADRRAAHAVLQESFSAHFDHHAQSYEQWLDHFGGERFDWSLCWIAAVDGIGDTGALQARDDREPMGWVRALGVLEAGRGRGVGSHLLRTAFAEFARRGRDTVGLGVDTENVTDALRLYQGLGMSLHYAVDTWELRAPAAAT